MIKYSTFSLPLFREVSFFITHERKGSEMVNGMMSSVGLIIMIHRNAQWKGWRKRAVIPDFDRRVFKMMVPYFSKATKASLLIRVCEMEC